MTLLFVSNLPQEVTEEELRNYFMEFGRVRSAKIRFDRYTGLSKGIGFVEMEYDHEAETAVEECEDREWNGRVLRVYFTRPSRTDKPRRQW